jgi:hypothetical protein
MFVLLSEALIYYNTGNMIYAAIGSAAIFFILFVGALFFLLWPPTGYIITLIIAWGLGLVSDCRLTMLLSRFDGVSNTSSSILGSGNYYWSQNDTYKFHWKKLLEINVSSTTGRSKFVIRRLRMLANWVSSL